MSSSLYLGLISGTSADAVDAALVDFAGTGKRVIAARAFPFPGELRARVLAVSQQQEALSLRAVGQLDTALGRLFAHAANELLRVYDVDRRSVRAIGSHGQTILHAPNISEGFTMQLADPNIIAERTGIDVVADFRRRDVAAGGQGAPLVPGFHAAMLNQQRQRPSHATGNQEPGNQAVPNQAVPNQVVVNLGGIANITILRAKYPITGFDTGPANALLDAWCQRHTGQPMDRDAAFARSGVLDRTLLARMLDTDYLRMPPPKSTGRDHFHLGWLEQHLVGNEDPADVQRTLCEFTVATVAQAIYRYAPDAVTVWLCGGGVHNPLLKTLLQEQLAPRAVYSTAFAGFDPDFVEAAAFAWLAQCFITGSPGNCPAVTGARSARRLGALFPSR